MSGQWGKHRRHTQHLQLPPTLLITNKTVLQQGGDNSKNGRHCTLQQDDIVF